MLQAKTQNGRQLQQTAGDSRPFNTFYCSRVKICKSVSLSTMEIREKIAANTLARTTDKLQRISEENICQGEKYQIRCVKQYGKITQELLSQQIHRPCNPNDCNSALEHLLVTVCLLRFYYWVHSFITGYIHYCGVFDSFRHFQEILMNLRLKGYLLCFYGNEHTSFTWVTSLCTCS